MNIYLELTRQFNQGRLRAVLAGGQAAVLHRVAMMSKDGDWILREEEETMSHVISVLAGHGAQYRFGAPLDVRWMAGGWSAHLEFQHGGIRVRTDFVTRPPRMDALALEQLWKAQEGKSIPYVGLTELAELKKTNREKDYAVIGELARMMQEADQQLLYSRSARDLIVLAEKHPQRIKALEPQRSLLGVVRQGVAELEVALDAERRRWMHANEDRLAKYMAAAEPWAAAWPNVAKEIGGRPLAVVHRLLTAHAEGLLPFTASGGQP